MKKSLFVHKSICFVALLLATMLSCTSNKSEEKPILSVSIEPQKCMLESLVGNKYTVNTAIPAGSNPETYDPSPSQMMSIGKSQVYFKVGKMGFENTWLNNIRMNNKDMKIVDCSVGVTPISDGGHHGEDPHIWSSPKSLSIMARNMYNALLENDPQNKDFYTEKYQATEKKIQQTDSIIRYYLDQAPTKSFIIYHPSLSYFANEYSLNQYSIEKDGKNPSPKELAELIEKGKKDGVTVVFLQQEFDQKNAEVIAQELGAKIVKINPLAYQWDEELITIAKEIAQK